MQQDGARPNTVLSNLGVWVTLGSSCLYGSAAGGWSSGDQSPPNTVFARGRDRAYDLVPTRPMPDLAPPDDLALAAVPASVKAAAAAAGAAGFFGIAHALQILGTVRAIRSPFDLLPPVIGVLAAVVLASGIGFARARRWAPLPAVVASSLLFATSAFWFLFALFNGLFTLFGMLVPGLSVIAVVFAVVGRKPCLVTADARRRLEEQGLELGV